jgi:cell division protein FtsW (lipid II flippase)
MREASPWRHLDPTAALAALALATLELLAIYSSTFTGLRAQGLPETSIMRRQLLNLGLGVVVMVAAMVVDYRRLQAIGEELGFAGSMALLALLGLLLRRGLRIATMARDSFGALLAAGVVAMLAFQAFVNIGMTVGIMPITGIPLPFVSYGGSSLVATFLAVGLLENVDMRRHL